MAWAHMSAILEPVNLTRHIYGFDSFEGFPNVSAQDSTPLAKLQKGGLSADSHDELLELIEIYDSYRFLGHVPKVELVKGDAIKTIPEFVASHRHLVVSLLFLDFDLYEPTRMALRHFFPRMPKGAVIAFDETTKMLSFVERRRDLRITSKGDWTSPLGIRFTVDPIKVQDRTLHLRRTITVISAYSFTVTEELSEDGGPFVRLGQAIFSKANLAMPTK